MIYFIMLIVVPLTIAILSSHFLSKGSKAGKENINTICEMEAINSRVLHFMSTFSTTMNDYSINIDVKDGKVNKIVTGTELTEKIFQNNEQITNQKAFSLRTIKIIIGIYMFIFSFCICCLVLIFLTK